MANDIKILIFGICVGILSGTLLTYKMQQPTIDTLKQIIVLTIDLLSN